MHRLRERCVPSRVSRSTRSTAARAPGARRARSPSTCTRTPCSRNSCTSRAMYSSSRSIRAEISVGGRCQFSSENANSVSTSTPASIAPSTTSRTAVIPARCPSGRGRCRSRAQRPLPSMMMATWRGTAPPKRILARRSSPTSDLHDLRLFAFDQLFHELQMVVMQLLRLLLGVLLVVLRDVLGLLDLVDRLRAGPAHADAPFFGELVHDLHQLLAALLRERRQGNADEVAIVGRREPEIGGQDRFLDRLDEALVPGLNGQELGLRGGNARHLVEGHLAAIGLDAYEVEERRGGLPCAHGGEFALHRLHRLVHRLFRLLEVLRERGHRTIVPTRSPASTLAVAPGWLMLNTTMGNRFSLHSPNAFASITAYPFTRASWKDSSGMNRAFGFFF